LCPDRLCDTISATNDKEMAIKPNVRLPGTSGDRR